MYITIVTNHILVSLKYWCNRLHEYGGVSLKHAEVDKGTVLYFMYIKFVNFGFVNDKDAYLLHGAESFLSS